jgi:hypothetical protein
MRVLGSTASSTLDPKRRRLEWIRICANVLDSPCYYWLTRFICAPSSCKTRVRSRNVSNRIFCESYYVRIQAYSHPSKYQSLPLRKVDRHWEASTKAVVGFRKLAFSDPFYWPLLTSICLCFHSSPISWDGDHNAVSSIPDKRSPISATLGVPTQFGVWY